MGVFRDAIVKHLQANAGVMATATKVFPGIPPKKDAVYPFITVIAQQPQRGERVYQAIDHEDATILVNAIDQSQSPKKAGEINRLVRAALNDNAALAIPGYSLINLMWIEDIEYTEEVDGVIYQHEGSFYLVQARQ